MDNETHGERTKARILAAGLALMREDPGAVTARRVARSLGMTHGACLYHFGSSAALRDAVAAHAVSERCGAVIPYLIAIRHAAVASMPDAERRVWLEGV